MTKVVRALNFRHVDRLMRLGGEKGVHIGYLNGATYDDRPEITVAQVALWNETGENWGEGFPGPFMGEAFKGNANHITLIRMLGRKVIAGTMSMDEVLTKLGERGVKAIRDQIDEFARGGGNAPATVKTKGMDTPFRHTDTMRSNIDYEKV